MKRVLWVLLSLSFAVTSPGQIGPRPPTADAQQSGHDDYRLVERGAHQLHWERVTWSTNRYGEAEPRTNTFVELGTGLNFFDETTQQWQPSREEWQAYPGAIVAQAGQHKVILGHNLNLGGSVDVLAADGVRLISNPVGLGFYDPVDGRHALLAEIKDCAPEWGATTNEIIFRDCFDGIRGSIRYRYTRAGLHQYVALEQRLQLPAGFSDRTRLEFYTEFAPNTPLPRITLQVLRHEKKPALRAQMVEPDFMDSHLDFGQMAMGAGLAFVVGNTADERAIRVGKRFEVVAGRPVLTESVEFKQLEPFLAGLAAVGGQTGRMFAVNSARQIPGAKEKLLLPAKPFRHQPGVNEIQLAHAPGERPAVVIDYELLGSDADFTFMGDTVYYVSGPVNLSGTTRIEGGTVVKFTNSADAQISIAGGAVCDTAAYRPAIFTSQDDNSIGDAIPGSTGVPGGYYGTGLAIGTSGNTLHDLRFSYASSAVTLDFSGGQIQLANVQFVNCQYPVDSSANDENTVLLDNGLMQLAKYGFNAGNDSILRAQHLTAHQCEQLAHALAGGDGNAYLTNCLLVGVTNWGDDFTFTTNTTAYYAADAGGIFQTVGAGSHYLATDDWRNTGTTNVTPDLLAALRKKTTWPPVVLSNLTVYASTNLVPQATRDADTPDLGYHYAPIDYLTWWFTVSNATLTVSNGAAIACYSDTGVWIADGGSIVSVGTPLAPNWFTRASLVQEQAVSFGAGPPASVNSYHYADPGPTGSFRFSAFSCPAGANDFHFIHYDYSAEDRFAFDSLALRDCEFWNGESFFGGSRTRAGSATARNSGLTTRPPRRPCACPTT